MNSTPDISDKFPELKFINIQFRNFGSSKFFFGEIVTAICPEDNSKIKKIDSVNNLYVQEFNNDYVKLRIKYLGNLKKMINQLKKENIELKLVNDQWIIAIL